MDINSIATEIADHLRGLDSIATATVETAPSAADQDSDWTDTWVTVKTQGGILYVISVEVAP